MTTKTTHWTRALKRLGACDEAVTWASDYDSLESAWAACERGDWMLWLAGRRSVPRGSDARRTLALAACECARLALPHVRAGDARQLHAIETAERWARGEDGVTLADVRTAAYAAYAYAAALPDAAAYAATAAAYAAYAAAYAAEAAAYAWRQARKTTLRKCADIVRKHYPQPPRLGRKED